MSEATKATTDAACAPVTVPAPTAAPAPNVASAPDVASTPAGTIEPPFLLIIEPSTMITFKSDNPIDGPMKTDVKITNNSNSRQAIKVNLFLIFLVKYFRSNVLRMIFFKCVHQYHSLTKMKP